MRRERVQLPVESVGLAAEEPARDAPLDPVELAFELWDDDCAIFASVNGVSIEEAAVRLKAAKEVGRTPISGSTKGG